MPKYMALFAQASGRTYPRVKSEFRRKYIRKPTALRRGPARNRGSLARTSTGLPHGQY